MVANTHLFELICFGSAYYSYTQPYSIYSVTSKELHLIKGTPLQSSGDGSHDIEQPTTHPVTARPNDSGTETNNDVFQLDLADWKAVGEGALVPFEHITITGQLGEGKF